MSIFLIIVAVLALIALVLYFFYKKSKGIHKLPLDKWYGLKYIPAVPYDLYELPTTLLKLNGRAKETIQTKTGCSTEMTIGGQLDTAYNFMYSNTVEEEHADARKSLHNDLSIITGSINNKISLVDHVPMIRPLNLLRYESNIKKALENTAIHHKEKEEEAVSYLHGNKRPLTQFKLDQARDYAMSWTTVGNLHQENVRKYADKWATTLEDVDAATQSFWPMIAEYGLAYNLLVIQKCKEDFYKKVHSELIELDKNAATALAAVFATNNLYAIDMRLFDGLQPQKASGLERFTPSTLTFLQQDPVTKAMTPFIILVQGYQGRSRTVFIKTPDTKISCTDGTWLYALQAAKTSLTVYGIWCGHVYHWHIVTAAMQMTMYHTLSKGHPIYKLLAPHYKYLIGFDEVLLLLWKGVAPPTSIISGKQFLEFTDAYVKETDRNFYDDDPTNTIEKLGITPNDFKQKEDWDTYPVAKHLMHIWELVEQYITVFVEESYTENPKKGDKRRSITGDKELQAWIAKSTDPKHGNIEGLSMPTDKQSLIKFLTSLLYRVVAHGNSRLERAANPALTFVGNFPPCLQRSTIPIPTTQLSSKELLSYMPHTGTIGAMVNFYYTFIYSAPYESFIPIDGIATNLPFKDEDCGGKRINEAAITMRTNIQKFIQSYDAESPIINQWPSNIET